MATQGPFDIVHGHSAKAGAIVRLAGVATRAIRVYTAHAFVTLDPELGGLTRKIYTSAERLLALLGSAVICVSQEEREHAIQAGIPVKDGIFVVNNGLGALPAPDRAAVRRGWTLKEGDVCLGFVGRISRQKAVHRLIEVFSKLYERYSNVYLVIVGEGPLLDTVKELAEHLGVAGRVIFHGSGNGPALMAGFDLFTLTSRYEAFPYVYLEALARGLPIVTTRVGGSGSVVREGINGHVVDHDDQERFVELVGELCGDPQRREEMGRASQRLASQFTVDNMVAQTVKVYRRLLHR